MLNRAKMTVVVLLLLNVCCCSVLWPYSGGSGTADDPYQLASFRDLIDLGDTPADYDKHFILTADIIMSQRFGFAKAVIAPIWHWEPFFTRVYPETRSFTGSFDGNGHVIRDLYMEGGAYLGLFGVLGAGAQVRNLGLVDVHIEGGPTGALAVCNESATVVNCYSTGTVRGGYVVGGLIGGMPRKGRGYLFDCHSSTVVIGETSVGGLVGINMGGCVVNSHTSGTVRGRECVGGLVGGLPDTQGSRHIGSVLQCYSTASVRGESHVGGLVGNNGSGTISHSYSTGTVTGGVQTGGLVGSSGAGGVAFSYSTGPVSGRYDVGGLIGLNGSWYPNLRRIGATLVHSYSTGTVSATNHVGGLVGYNTENSLVATSFSTGEVSGESDIGGLVGLCDEPRYVVDSFWDIQSSGQSMSAAGRGLTTALMQDSHVFQDAGWDFSGETDNGTADIWQMPEPVSYPVLTPFPRFEATQPAGRGTAQDPFLITDVPELYSIRLQPLAHYRLDADIDLSEIVWPCAVIPWFGGTLDGNNHVTRHLHVEGGSYLGLFGMLGRTARVRNLELAEVDISGFVAYFKQIAPPPSRGRSLMAQLAQQAVVRGNYIGALAGSNEGLVLDCRITGSLNGRDYIGGLVGMNRATISFCSSDGTVSGEDYVGGLIGMIDAGTVSHCRSSGLVSGLDTGIGGLVGLNMDKVASSYSTSKVQGGRYVGGLLGENGEKAQLLGSYSAGAVGGDEGVGGLVGNNVLTIGGSGLTWSDASWWFGVSRGEIPPRPVWMSENQRVYTGRIANCFWDIGSSGLFTSDGGTGLFSAQMKNAQVFLDAGWDFANSHVNGSCGFWQIPETGGYPLLTGVDDVNPIQLEGQGTPDAPFLISNVQELGAIWYHPLAHYRLSEDVDLAGIVWKTVVIPRFWGSLDGDGHVIKNLHIETFGDCGLFGVLEASARVWRLGLSAVDVNGPANETCEIKEPILPSDYPVCKAFSAGGLAAKNHGHITDCYSIGVVRGDNAVGGLIGENYGNITRCFSEGSISGNESIGGLVGVQNDGQTTRSYSRCFVSGEKYVGGLLGLNNEGLIANTYSVGEIQKDDWGVEGLVGESFGRGVHYSYSVVHPRYGAVNCIFYYTSDREKPLEKTSDLQAFLEAGWDFVGETANGTDDIWVMPAKHLPRLSWEEVDLEGDYSGGSGTEEDPYQLSTAQDIILLSDTPVDWDKHFLLTADINLDGVEWPMAPIAPGISNSFHIGWWRRRFSGSLDGNGHALKNLRIRGQGRGCLGLFGYLGEGALVSNLGVVNVDIAGATGRNGALAGYCISSSIVNCYSTGSISGDDYVGGLVGELHKNSSISRSYSSSTVSGRERIGGLTGAVNESSSISDSYSTSSVTGDRWVGGLVGSSRSVSITASENTGTVNGSSSVGGLVGSTYFTTVIDCNNTGLVQGEENVGGVIGNNSGGQLNGCQSAGRATGKRYVGGIVGHNNEGGQLTNCRSAGAVVGGQYVGGIVGWNSYGSQVLDCVSTADVSGDSDVGQLIGHTVSGGGGGRGRQGGNGDR